MHKHSAVMMDYLSGAADKAGQKQRRQEVAQLTLRRFPWIQHPAISTFFMLFQTPI